MAASVHHVCAVARQQENTGQQAQAGAGQGAYADSQASQQLAGGRRRHSDGRAEAAAFVERQALGCKGYRNGCCKRWGASSTRCECWGRPERTLHLRWCHVSGDKRALAAGGAPSPSQSQQRSQRVQQLRRCGAPLRLLSNAALVQVNHLLRAVVRGCQRPHLSTHRHVACGGGVWGSKWGARRKR